VREVALDVAQARPPLPDSPAAEGAVTGIFVAARAGASCERSSTAAACARTSSLRAWSGSATRCGRLKLRASCLNNGRTSASPLRGYASEAGQISR
jgi:hypothetical protein